MSATIPAVRASFPLVNIPSPTGSEGEVARELHKIMQGAGFRSTLQAIGDERYNAPGVLEGKGEGKSLMFNGHLDTVHLPFVPPRLEGDRLRGSGSSDMKAGTAAAVDALGPERVLLLPDGVEDHWNPDYADLVALA